MKIGQKQTIYQQTFVITIYDNKKWKIPIKFYQHDFHIHTRNIPEFCDDKTLIEMKLYGTEMKWKYIWERESMDG